MNFCKQTSPHGSLVALSTMKDEAPYIVEWVSHHLAVGFTDVMVYTNDCSDGTDTLLKRLEALDIGVHHRENIIPEGMKPHPSMLKLAAAEPIVIASDWLLVLDADEFMCINHPSGNLDGLVADLEAMGASAMVITWRIFGSNDVREWNRAPITEQFTRAAPAFWNKGWGTKTMLKFDPKYLRLGMHRPIIKSQHKDTDYPESVLWVNGSGQPMEEWFKFRGWRSIRRTLGYDWAQMNHYAIKSMDAYSLRKFRGNANLKKDKYNSDYWSLQDRNEVVDLAILRHRDRRAAIMAELLKDPQVRALHEAAHARAEARLAEYRPSQAYQDLVASLIEASNVPISQVVAKPPKARDPAEVAAVQSKLEKKRAARPKDERRTAPPPGWGTATGSPYVGGVIDLSYDVPLEEAENQGLMLPVDPRVFNPVALEAVQNGKFDRRHARNIGGYLNGATRLLDLGAGIGFVSLKAKLLHPALIVKPQDDRSILVEIGRGIARRNLAAQLSDIQFDDTPLRRDDDPDGCWPGLAALVARFRPDALRLPGDLLPPEGFAAALDPETLTGVNRVIIPCDSQEAADAARAALGPLLEAAGLAPDPEAEANGSLFYRRN
jgi:hypothetical protein